ncbi:hypothetical protein APD39_07955 [Acinetobacter pittii]|nr:hypothetical protein APD39_07955 [Acinetobacter pittii]
MFKDQKSISTLSEIEKKYFEKCVSASNDKYAAEEVIYDIGVGFAGLCCTNRRKVELSNLQIFMQQPPF